MRARGGIFATSRRTGRHAAAVCALWLTAGSLLPGSPGAISGRLAQGGGPEAPHLYRLELEAGRFLPAPARVAAEDLEIDLVEGAGFVASAAGEPTALVLVGEGRLRFMPPLASERRQLALFCGSPELSETFEAAFLRFHPDDFEALVTSGAFAAAAGPEKLRRRAQAVFDEEIGRAYALEEGGRAGATLSALPPRSDLLIEFRTRRLGRLAYARVAENPEDILLLDRDNGRTVASYPSRAHGSASSLDYGDEAGLPYEALSYDVSLDVDPRTLSLAGHTRIVLRAVVTLETISLRLDGGLAVAEVKGPSGPHQFLQRKSSDTLLVRVTPPLPAGGEIALEVTYSGQARPQELWREIGGGRSAESAAGHPARTGEEGLLYSNRVYYFPQSPVRNHTPVSLRVQVPEGYTAVASGIPEAQGAGSESAARVFVFRAAKPIRYLSLFVGRLSQVEELQDPAPVPVHIFAEAPLATRARQKAAGIARILGFFTELAGQDAYPYLAAVFVAAPLPAGHSPAYLCLVGEPPGWTASRAEDDPAYDREEPDFALAHEIAHQWWGQAVGWRNYREQWLSEGLAQYFAALYVRRSRGEEAFESALGWMQRWARRAAGRGPVNLGVRVGEFGDCPKCFVAALYDRGALALHMLRGLLGDEPFWRGLRLYGERWKFRRAATADLERAFEEASGRDLSRFFDQWIRQDGLPMLEWSAASEVRGARARLLLRVRQVGETYELPLSVSIDSSGKSSRTEIIRVSRSEEVFGFDLDGPLRRVRVNADHGALCELRER